MAKRIKKITEPSITLNEYLSKYNRKRILDNVIKKWYFKIDNSNQKKQVYEWNNILNSFYNETEK